MTDCVVLARRINVLHVVLSFRRGGRRNAIASLAAHMTDSANSHLCCLEEFGCGIDELDGLFLSRVALGKKPGRFFWALRDLVVVCQQRKVDLIHAHDAASQYVGTLARLARPRTKLLMTFHRTLGFESARYRDKLRNGFCGLFSQAIVTASNERKRHFLSENALSESKLVVIPFGVDLDEFQADPQTRLEVRSSLRISERTVVIGTIGHFGPEKGVDQAVEAFNNFVRRYPASDVVLLILGDGAPEQREKITRLSQLHPSGRVILVGFQSEVGRWFSAFDVLLHTPRMEAFGLVVIEAMACKLPVVATGVGSIPEIVRNGETGLVVEPGSIDAIVSGLTRIIQTPGLRQTLGLRAHKVAQKEYSSILCADRYARLYQRICSGE